MANNNIDIMGVLNSVTSDQTVAKADQVEITLYDGTKKKIPNELLSYIKGVDSNYLTNFMSSAVGTNLLEDRIFLCTSTVHSTFEQGHFYYYTGSTHQITDITPQMGGGGGNTSNVILQVTYPSKEVMETSREFTIQIQWQSRNTGRGSVICTIDGSSSLGKTFFMTPGLVTWTVKDLPRGTHTIRIVAYDSSNMQSTPSVMEISVGTLAIETAFSDNKIFALNDPVSVSYTYYTNDPSKQTVLVTNVDGIEEIVPNIGAQGTRLNKYFTGLSEGEHVVKLKIKQFNLDENEVEIDVKESNELVLHIIIADAKKIYLSRIGDENITTREREKVELGAKLAYVGTRTCNAKLEVYRANSLGEWVLDTSKEYGAPSIWTAGNQYYITTFSLHGTYKCDITVTSPGTDDMGEYMLYTAVVTYYVTVNESLLLSIDPIVDSSLLLHLSAAGKTNNDADRETWRDISVDEIQQATGNVTRNPVSVELHDFNWASNGWFTNEKGESYLNISGGAYAVVNLQPFSSAVGGNNGLTVDIEFETEDILYNTAKVMSCYSGSRGFWIDTEYATLANNMTKQEISQQVEIETDFSEIIGYEDKVDDQGNPIYLDHVSNQETSSPTTTVDDVVYDNVRAQTPLYAQYERIIQTGPFQTNFQSNTKTRVTFVIQRGTLVDGVKDYGDYQFECMCIYINGVLTSVERLSANSDFGQAIPSKIYLGCDSDLSNKGKAYIYNLRVYNRALSMTEVLTNYVSDIEDAQEQNDMIRRNALGNVQESNSLPTMEFFVTEEDWSRMNKDTKIFGRMQYIDNDNVENTITGVNFRCQWQGTSTLAYAVKNLKIRLYDTLKEEGVNIYKGGHKHKYDLGNGIPEYIFTLKADYMDSMHGRNTAMANFVSDLRKDAVCPPQEFKAACRTSVYGFPIQLYVTKYSKKSFDGENIVFDDNDKISRELFGVYNFNLDKNSTDSLGLMTKKDFLEEFDNASEIGSELATRFETNYPEWDPMSFEGAANSDTGAGAFNTDDDSKVYSEFELRFEDEGDIIDEGVKTSAGALSMTDLNNEFTSIPQPVTSSTRVKIANVNTDINGEYDVLMTEEAHMLVGKRHILHKVEKNMDTNGILGDYTVDYDFMYKGAHTPVYLTFTTLGDEMTISTIESGESRVARRYSHLKKFIKWVKDADDVTFKRDLHKHVDIDAVLDYYTTVLTVLMVDNFGKNVMWDTWGPISQEKKIGNNNYDYTPEEIRTYDDYIWYPHFYDCDTCLGLDNSGNMRFDVSDGFEYNTVMETDDIAPGVFNTSKSKFWSKFRKLFATEIKNHYVALRSYDSSATTPETRRSTYTEKSFNEYFYDRQISKISEASYNNDFKQKYLKNPDYLFMMHGRQYEFFERFISQRLYFLDTFFGEGAEANAQGTIRVEYNDFATRPVTFNISTYKPAYVTVLFTAASGSDKSLRLKVPRNATIEFSGYVDTATDQEVRIYNAPNIKKFGDVSSYSPKTVDVSQMTKLTELSVGTEEYPNSNLKSISVGSNTYLTRLVAERCTAMTEELNVSGCTNLKYVSTVGSTIPGIIFNEAGGSLEEAHFAYDTTTVSLSNFKLLREITFEEVENKPFMGKVTTMRISNCPLLLGYYDADAGKYVDGYLAGNILNRWAPTDIDTKINIDGVYGKISDYSFLNACSTIQDQLTDLMVQQGHSANDIDYESNIRVTGRIEYRGTVIPEKYATYGLYFPNLLITYDNVTNFSNMFKNYNNINSIISREFKWTDEITGKPLSEWRYYWKTLSKELEEMKSLDTSGSTTHTMEALNIAIADTEHYDVIDNYPYRKLKCYEDDDMENLASEIKTRLAPFTNASDFSGMFMNDEILEYLDDDTFDNFTFTDDINTVGMFQGCRNLKYFEVPRMKKIDSYAFTDCKNTVIFVPNTVSAISQSAFSDISGSDYGQHKLVLFEENSRFTGVSDGLTDVRFNIVCDENGRALRTGLFYCPEVWAPRVFSYIDSHEETIIDEETGEETVNVVEEIVSTENDDNYENVSDGLDYNRNLVPLTFQYFLNNSEISQDISGNKLIYKVYGENKDDPIRMRSWNIDTRVDNEGVHTSKKNFFGNPLEIDEMLYGSMSNFVLYNSAGTSDNAEDTGLREISIPPFHVSDMCATTPSYNPLDLSIAKLFSDKVEDPATIRLPRVNLLMSSRPQHVGRFINKYLFKSTEHIPYVYCQRTVEYIEEQAFQDAVGLRSFLYYPESPETNTVHTIGPFAFSNTHISKIFIPNSVTSIGEGAFQNNKFLTSIRYSSAMRVVPIYCFADCAGQGGNPVTVTGFSPEIEDIQDFAFQNSSDLQLVGHDSASTDRFECHWIAVQSDHGSDYQNPANSDYLFNYFTNLVRIGKFAFDDIDKITTIKLNPNIKFIGARAFRAGEHSNIETKLVWKSVSGSESYADLKIDEYAFFEREFYWQSNIPGDVGLISKCVYIPSSVGIIGESAFSPTPGGTRSKLYYTITDAPSKPSGWLASYAFNTSRENIYNVNSLFVEKRLTPDTRYFTIEYLEDDVDLEEELPKLYIGTLSPTSTQLHALVEHLEESGQEVPDGQFNIGEIYIYCNNSGSNHNWNIYMRTDNNGIPVWSQMAAPNNKIQIVLGENESIAPAPDDIPSFISSNAVYDEDLGKYRISYRISYKTMLSTDHAMYVLHKNSTATYLYLIQQSVNIEIPQYVTSEDETNYEVKKIANEALIDNGENLNTIAFNENSHLETIGKHLFNTENIMFLRVGEDNTKYIPESVTSIGTNTPYKQTNWFDSIEEPGYVYLNSVCIGYSSGSDDEPVPISEYNVPMRAGTKIIYDAAFKATSDLVSIDLPSTLERIETSAFENCTNLASIDFSPCAAKLKYIGDYAFSNDTGLREMVYTRAIEHVGNGAVNNTWHDDGFGGGYGISKYVFEEGCRLDNTSSPIYAPLDSVTGLNKTIAELFIPASMGAFFSDPNSNGYMTLITLSQLKTLVLGDYDIIDISDCFNSNNNTYEINFRTKIGWDSAMVSNSGVLSDLIISGIPAEMFPGGVFYKARSTYESPINISGLTSRWWNNANIIQTFMGYKPLSGSHPNAVQVTVKSDIASNLGSGSLSRLIAGRISAIVARP